MSEKPSPERPRRLSHWINVGQEKKIHSLIDKVYSKKNLEIAWEAVRKNGGTCGVDWQSIGDFEEKLDENLDQLHEELRTGKHKPQALRRVYIPKAGKKDEFRPLSIPAVRDRVCQQALSQRMVQIFEPDMDESNFGYRKGRSPHDALRKVWREIQAGRVWIVDADLKDFFGSVSHSLLMQLVTRRISDGRVLKLIEQMLRAPIQEGNELTVPNQGTPQGGVVSPALSNVLLTPFDKEMRARGYHLTRFADDWVATCATRAEAKAALETARKILNSLGVTLHPGKTRIVHVSKGFEFLGFVIRKGKKPMKLPAHRRTSGVREGAVYAYPTNKSRERFKEQIRNLTKRKRPGPISQVIDDINPVVRGWGNYYKKAHVRKLFHQLDGWVVRRLWAWRYKRWRNAGWRKYPTKRLRVELGLVGLVSLIPSLEHKYAHYS